MKENRFNKLQIFRRNLENESLRRRMLGFAQQSAMATPWMPQFHVEQTQKGWATMFFVGTGVGQYQTEIQMGAIPHEDIARFVAESAAIEIYAKPLERIIQSLISTRRALQ